MRTGSETVVEDRRVMEREKKRETNRLKVKHEEIKEPVRYNIRVLQSYPSLTGKVHVLYVFTLQTIPCYCKCMVLSYLLCYYC